MLMQTSIIYEKSIKLTLIVFFAIWQNLGCSRAAFRTGDSLVPSVQLPSEGPGIGYGSLPTQALTGSWSGCSPDPSTGGSMLYSLAFEENGSFDESTSYFDSNDCTGSPSQTLIASGHVGDSSSQQDSQTFHLHFEYLRAYLEIFETGLVTQFNSVNVCGISNWQLAQSTSISPTSDCFPAASTFAIVIISSTQISYTNTNAGLTLILHPPVGTSPTPVPECGSNVGSAQSSCLRPTPTPPSSNLTCEIIKGQATSLASPGVVVGTGSLPVGDYGAGVVSVSVSCSGERMLVNLGCTSAEGQRENSAGFSIGHCHGIGPAGPNAFPINYHYMCCSM